MKAILQHHIQLNVENGSHSYDRIYVQTILSGTWHIASGRHHYARRSCVLSNPRQLYTIHSKGDMDRWDDKEEDCYNHLWTERQAGWQRMGRWQTSPHLWPMPSSRSGLQQVVLAPPTRKLLPAATAASSESGQLSLHQNRRWRLEQKGIDQAAKAALEKPPDIEGRARWVGAQPRRRQA
jgi:hypothetical protein